MWLLWFVKYKQSFCCTCYDVAFVARDRQWFEDSLPKFRQFHAEMLAAQAAARGNPSLYTPREPVARAPRKAPTSALPVPCLIDESLYNEKEQ